MNALYHFNYYRVHLLDADKLITAIWVGISYDELAAVTDFTPSELGQIQNLAKDDSGLVIGNMRIYRA